VDPDRHALMAVVMFSGLTNDRTLTPLPFLWQFFEFPPPLVRFSLSLSDSPGVLSFIPFVFIGHGVLGLGFWGPFSMLFSSCCVAFRGSAPFRPPLKSVFPHTRLKAFSLLSGLDFAP